MIIDGNKLAKDKLRSLGKIIKNKDLDLQLDILYIEKSASSEIFIKKKKQAAERIGIKVKVHTFDKISKDLIQATCNMLNFNSDCTGYLIQLPLGKNLDKNKILNFISTKKDVDCLNAQSLGKALQDPKSNTKPATVEAIVEIVKNLKIQLKSKAVTIVNDSNLIGKPLSAYFLRKGATVTICNEFTKNLEKFTRQADILVTAAGKPGLIKADMVKENSFVIDAGISKIKGKVRGDVEFEKVAPKVKAITPVPGGVGPLTVACLLSNLVKLHEQNTKSN